MPALTRQNHRGPSAGISRKTISSGRLLTKSACNLKKSEVSLSSFPRTYSCLFAMQSRLFRSSGLVALGALRQPIRSAAWIPPTGVRAAVQSQRPFHALGLARSGRNINGGETLAKGPSAEEEEAAFEALGAAEGLAKGSAAEAAEAIPLSAIPVSSPPAAGGASPSSSSFGAQPPPPPPGETAPPYFFFAGRYYYPLSTPPPSQPHPTAAFLGEQITRTAHSLSTFAREAESVAMKAAAIDDKKRFRFIVAVATLTVGAIVYTAWPRIKTETQESLVEAAGSLLSAKDLQLDASTFAKAVINETLSDPKIHALLVSVATEALQDQKTQESVRQFSYNLLAWLSKEPWFNQMVLDLVLWVLAQKFTTDATAALGSSSLADPALQDTATKALTDVFWRAFDDKALQEKAQQWTWTVVSKSIPAVGFFGGGGGGGAADKHKKADAKDKGNHPPPPPPSTSSASSAAAALHPSPPSTAPMPAPAPTPATAPAPAPVPSPALQSSSAATSSDAAAPVAALPASRVTTEQETPSTMPAPLFAAPTTADVDSNGNEADVLPVAAVEAAASSIPPSSSFFESALEAVQSSAQAEQQQEQQGDASTARAKNGSRRRLRSMSDILLRTPVVVAPQLPPPASASASSAPSYSPSSSPSEEALPSTKDARRGRPSSLPPPMPRGPGALAVASDSGFGGESIAPEDWSAATDVNAPGLVRGFKRMMKEQPKEKKDGKGSEQEQTEAPSSGSAAAAEQSQQAVPAGNSDSSVAVPRPPIDDTAPDAIAETVPITASADGIDYQSDGDGRSSAGTDRRALRDDERLAPPPIVDLATSFPPLAGGAPAAIQSAAVNPIEEEPAVVLTAPLLLVEELPPTGQFSAPTPPAAQQAPQETSTGSTATDPALQGDEKRKQNGGQSSANGFQRFGQLFGSFFSSKDSVGREKERGSAEGHGYGISKNNVEPLSLFKRRLAGNNSSGSNPREAAVEAERKLSLPLSSLALAAEGDDDQARREPEMGTAAIPLGALVEASEPMVTTEGTTALNSGSKKSLFDDV